MRFSYPKGSFNFWQHSFLSHWMQTAKPNKSPELFCLTPGRNISSSTQHLMVKIHLEEEKAFPYQEYISIFQITISNKVKICPDFLYFKHTFYKALNLYAIIISHIDFKLIPVYKDLKYIINPFKLFLLAIFYGTLRYLWVSEPLHMWTNKKKFL